MSCLFIVDDIPQEDKEKQKRMLFAKLLMEAKDQVKVEETRSRIVASAFIMHYDKHKELIAELGLLKNGSDAIKILNKYL